MCLARAHVLKAGREKRVILNHVLVHVLLAVLASMGHAFVTNNSMASLASMTGAPTIVLDTVIAIVARACVCQATVVQIAALPIPRHK
jgi:hypothetical protein